MTGTWTMAVMPSPFISFAGAKRGEGSTAGCGRGGEEKGRRRLQVGVGGLENTSSFWMINIGICDTE